LAQASRHNCHSLFLLSGIFMLHVPHGIMSPLLLYGSTMRLALTALSAAFAALPVAAASASYSGTVAKIQGGPCFIQQHYSSLLHSGEVLHSSGVGAANNVGVGSAVSQAEQAKGSQSTQVLPLGEKLRQAAGNESWATVWVHRVELHVPKPISSLHKSKLGPIWKFAQTLKDALCEAAALSSERLVILDVRSEGLNITLLNVSNATGKSGFQQILDDADKSKSKETVFDIEISPRISDMETPAPLALELWRQQLASGNGSLGKGGLVDYLKGATVTQAGHQPPPSSGGAWHLAGMSLWTTSRLLPALLLAAGVPWLPVNGA